MFRKKMKKLSVLEKYNEQKQIEIKQFQDQIKDAKEQMEVLSKQMDDLKLNQQNHNA